MRNKYDVSPIWLLPLLFTLFSFLDLSMFETMVIIFTAIFFYELSLSLFSRHKDMKIIIKGRFFAYIENNKVWVHIFETKNIRDIQWSELTQLKHLKYFSLVFSSEYKTMRLFVYAKSFEELKTNININKPIIDVLLPENYPLEKKELTSELRHFTLNFYNKNKVAIIENDNYFCLPISDLTNNYSNSINTNNLEMILAHNPSKESSRNTGIYYLKNIKKNYFFDYMIKKILCDEKQGGLNQKDYQKLRLRLDIKIAKHFDLNTAIQKMYQLKSFFSPEKIVESFDINNGTNMDITMSDTPEINKKNLPNESVQQPCSVDNKQFLEQITAVEHSSSFSNQICFELCNIFSTKKTDNSIKDKKCLSKSNFSKKLLKNEDFQLLIENVLTQKNIVETEHLIKELIHQISFQQLICILSHILFDRAKDFPIDRVENVMHILITTLHQQNSVQQENREINQQEPLIHNTT